ncbi:MAG: hypothetical protein J6M62_02580 [Selenomonadaceae bacterium]|nr:hypothetical protein [Selenomonadaceae bacterium]MBP3723812.1 hypothetical protein [Selenomonadaceae bacterium]
MPKAVNIYGQRMTEFTREEVKNVYFSYGYKESLVNEIVQRIMGDNPRIALCEAPFSKDTTPRQMLKKGFSIANIIQNQFFDDYKIAHENGWV